MRELCSYLCDHRRVAFPQRGMVVSGHEHTARKKVGNARTVIPEKSPATCHVRVGLCPHGCFGRSERFDVESADGDNLRANIVQEGVCARVDAVREVDGAGYAEYLRGARSRKSCIAPGRTYDAQCWPVCRERALYKERDAAVLKRV